MSAESTVVAEFVPHAVSAVAYQSEAELEREFIRLLQSQAYEYLPITSEEQPVANLRVQHKSDVCNLMCEVVCDGDEFGD